MADSLTDMKRAVLAAYVKQRAELDVLIAGLRRDLGEAAEEAPNPPDGAPPVNLMAATQVNVNELVTPGDFLGMTQVEAIQAFLQRAGKSRPVTLQDIAAALFRGKATETLLEGMKLKNLSSVLSRNQTFLSVARGRWGLTEWYPKSVVEARRKANARAGDAAEEKKEEIAQ